jgi:hypothetical protein
MRMTRVYPNYAKDWDAVIRSAEQKLERLRLERQIAAIDDKLARLAWQRGMYAKRSAEPTEVGPAVQLSAS